MIENFKFYSFFKSFLDNIFCEMSYFLVNKNLLGLLERVQHNVIIIYVILSRWRYTSESFILLNMFAKSILLFFCRSGMGIYHTACGRFLAQLFIIPMISGQGRARSEITPFIFDLESSPLPSNTSTILNLDSFQEYQLQLQLHLNSYDYLNQHISGSNTMCLKAKRMC